MKRTIFENIAINLELLNLSIMIGKPIHCFPHLLLINNGQKKQNKKTNIVSKRKRKQIYFSLYKLSYSGLTFIKSLSTKSQGYASFSYFLICFRLSYLYIMKKVYKFSLQHLVIFWYIFFRKNGRTSTWNWCRIKQKEGS